MIPKLLVSEGTGLLEKYLSSLCCPTRAGIGSCGVGNTGGNCKGGIGLTKSSSMRWPCGSSTPLLLPLLCIVINIEKNCQKGKERKRKKEQKKKKLCFFK